MLNCFSKILKYYPKKIQTILQHMLPNPETKGNHELESNFTNLC